MMGKRRVLKFGGAALRDGEAVARAARIVHTHGGVRPIVVVSAHQGVTDLLERSVREAAAGRLAWDEVRIRHRTLLRQLGLPAELLARLLRDLEAVLGELAAAGRVDHRARDFVLSFGERMSARIVSAVLGRQGTAATPLDAFDLGLVHEPRPREGGAVAPPPVRVREALAGVPGVPVVTGFLAQDPAGHVVTLGRNGSDLSAAWIAEAAGAHEIQLWKTVAGVRTADPGLVPDTRILPRLGWDEAIELSAQGAAVLHPGTAEPARRADIPIRLLSVDDPDAPGTTIHGRPGPPGPRALAHRASVRLWRGPLATGRGRADELAALYAALRDAGIEPWLGAATTCEVAVVFDGDGAGSELPRGLSRGGKLEGGLASLGVVGHGLTAGDDPWARMQRALTGAGIDVRPVSGGCGVHGRVCLVRAAELGRALCIAHATLFTGLSTGLSTGARAEVRTPRPAAAEHD